MPVANATNEIHYLTGFGGHFETEAVPGALLEVRGAGAYAFSMSSQYNSRPRAAEVLVDGDRFAVGRSRESVEDLFRAESPDPAWSGA